MTIVIEEKTLPETANKLAIFLYGKPLEECIGKHQNISWRHRNEYILHVKKINWEAFKNVKAVSRINSMIAHANKQPDTRVSIIIS